MKYRIAFHYSFFTVSSLGVIYVFKKNSSPHGSISNGGPGVILQVLEPAINFIPSFFRVPFICKTHLHLVCCLCGSKASFISSHIRVQEVTEQ